ncbi:carbohydrate ABC transporter permease [Nonomuraea ferruginea]
MRRALVYLMLTVASLVMVLPLLYMLSLSLQTEAETLAAEAVIVPESPQWGNYAELFERAPFGDFIVNSLVVAGAITLAHLLFDPLVGYVFAKFRFPLRNTLFVALLATLMVPFFVRMIPLYVLMAHLGWINTYQGLITPFLMDAFGIFLMRQFIQPIPDDLIHAARIDGASEFAIYRRIILPQTRPSARCAGAVHVRVPVERVPVAAGGDHDAGDADDPGRAHAVQPGVLHPLASHGGGLGDPVRPHRRAVHRQPAILRARYRADRPSLGVIECART